MEKAVLLGIIFIRGGSSWFSGTHETELIAAKTVKVLVRDWKHLFKFEKDDLYPVHIFDISDCPEGWYATGTDVFCQETKKSVKFLKTLKVAK